MPSDDPLARSLTALSGFFVGNATVEDTLHRVAVLAEEAVPAADLAGMTMLVEGRPTTAVFTDEGAAEIDAAQYETGIGPCLDSFREEEVLGIGDTLEDTRWPPFSKAAVEHGIRSTLSLPLVANHKGLGALNLYSRRPHGFTEDDVEVGSRFAAQAAIVLANSQVYWDAVHMSQNLTTAMASRAVIEQAKGILMQVQHCTADEAFQLLVRASQRENRKLREIAEEIVARAQHADRPSTEGLPG